MTPNLHDLRGLRTAPSVNPAERTALRLQLQQHLSVCEWFTVGVMAATGAAALEALRTLEAAQGWRPLEADPVSPLASDVPGPAFLKGNQNTGRFLLRPEAGLGEGILISGHSPSDPDAEDTWGPFPLDLFDDHDG